jgi:hypothetical protein
MAFWSSQNLEAKLTTLTDHPDPAMVDCNALTLRVGPEVYVTPGLDQPAPSSYTKELLGRALRLRSRRVSSLSC